MDADEIHRRADQAKELKDDPAFQAAILALRKEWFGMLMAGAQSSPEQKLELVARLRALETIPQQLQVFMSDWEMVKRKRIMSESLDSVEGVLATEIAPARAGRATRRANSFAKRRRPSTFCRSVRSKAIR